MDNSGEKICVSTAYGVGKIFLIFEHLAKFGMYKMRECGNAGVTRVKCGK